MKNYNLKVNGHEYEVVIGNVNESSTEAEVTVNGVKYNVEIQGGKVIKTQKPQVVPVPAAASGIAVTPANTATKPQAVAADSSAYKVACPLPGTVTSVNVKEGDTVSVGQTLVVLEAMKMSNNIDAEKSGVVKSIAVAQGATVMEGQVLMVIE